MENSFLFVYGSLRPGAGHAQGAALARQGHYLGAASVSGALYRVSHYPALGPGGDAVAGEVYGIPEGYWAVLDAYEEAVGPDPEYRRLVTPVRLQSGLWLQAWVYWYARPLTGLVRIPGADWLSAPG